MEVYVDIGLKNFCYIIHNNLEIIDFNIITLKDSMLSIVKTLNDFVKSLNVHWYIESQIKRNTRCVKIQTILQTIILLNNQKYEMIQPKMKYKIFSTTGMKYYQRKKWVIEEGTKYLNKLKISQEILTKINLLIKKDDFFDCIMMIVCKNNL